MSTDELKRKTVCLKLAKNGIYLCKNPSNMKFVPTRDISFGLKQLKDLTNQQQVEVIRNTECGQNEQKKLKTEAQEETSLQKFIRGFDCGDFDEDTSNNYPSVSGQCSTSGNNNFCLNSDCFQENVPDLKHVMGGASSPSRCRVEFILPTNINEASVNHKEAVKPLKPLIVDLSQKKILMKDSPPIKILKTSKNELKLLNRNFITPKVKVENFSNASDSSNLPLIISPAETPNFQNGSPSQTPYLYPSTKIEIDYTASSIQENHLVEQDYSRNIKSEISDIGPSVSPTMIFGQDFDYGGQEITNETNYNFPNNMNQNQPMGIGTSQKDVMKAAKALYSKRTRTLFHWINPKIPKTKLKDSVMIAWDQLPSWQKQIYVNQVIGKCGSDSVSPMVNPQILDMSGMAEAVLSASANQQDDQNVPPPPKKKRKYTRKANVASSVKASNSTMSALAPGSSVYNFLASL